jgi:SAM-dependent methyltransferase
MNDPMQAEFDTVAQWTAEVAVELGPEYYIPAACRGSGSPTTLRWLADRLAIRHTDRMLDCGAGVGGPAAFAAQLTGVAPIVSEPEAGACRAARRLFGFPAVQAASELPFRSGTFTMAWSLGVLCTVRNQLQLLRELRRVLTRTGRLGLLVFVANGDLPGQAPAGNNFPSWDRLLELLAAAGFTVDAAATEADFEAAPADWRRRADAVHDELARRHHDDDRWLASAEQSDLIGNLLTRRDLTATMIITSPVL